MHKHLNTEAAALNQTPRSRRAIAWLTLVVYVGQPLAATAQVVADQAASAQKRPVIDTTANGIPLVQIATPNAAGLSHNQYTQYNVDPSGIILNNSSTSVLTQQAGYVPGNQNMANGTARIILNEVTSTAPSQLNGYTEVAGSRAEVIIANPNGISCNGCGFINTSRGVLTTGTPVFGGSGSLDAFRVSGGEINIGTSGLNASNTDQLDLISRSVKVNGELWGKDLNIITGTNQVNYANLGVQVISGDANKPAVGIDVALLGGMYANKIRLIGTEAGVGVNSQGNIAAQAGDITIDNQGVITLAGNTIAAGNLSLSGTRISSTGNLGAGIDTSGVASRNGTLALAATDPTGSITNSGRIAGNTITSSSDTFTNTGTVIGDNITVRANTLNNLNASAIIASTQRLDLIIQNALENRDGATLYSLGDINIGSNNVIGADGYLTGRTGSINNQSATIEAGNDLRISANQITNKRSVVGLEWAPEILGAYVSGNPRYTPSYSDQRFTAGTTSAAQLLAGNNMWLSTGTITNDYSSIAAGQTLTSNATTINNTGAAFLQRMTVTNGLQDNWVWVETGWHWGIECAGGWSPFCWPVVVPEYGLRNFPIAYAPAPIYTTLGSANVTYAANTPLASPSVDSAALKAPSSGLYTIHNQPGQPYLIVTDARFISYQNFLSSDYMMSRLALDPALIQKRLGDGFYEQKLVAEQILHATGRRNLSGYSSTQASYQALMDEALAESRDLSLVPGIALSNEQIAALRRDIVWMVVEDVRLPDGTMTRALAPKVYFSQFGPMKLNPGGALIAANEVNFKSGGIFNNDGAVISDTATTLIVGDLINRGEIQSGGTLYLQAANDISNLSGSISGRNVGLSAGHDIRNERTSNDTGNTANSELGLASSITATDGLNMSSGHNLSIVGASVKAGGNASLSAGENITVGTLTTHENSSGVYNAYLNRISNLGSQLDVGGNLAMQAGNDLQLTAAKVNAGGDMSLIAGGDINLKSAMNSLARGYDSGVGLEKHYDATVIGTTLNAGGNVTLNATGVKTAPTGEQSTGDANSSSTNSQADGKGNIALEGASINSKNGTVSLVASGNVGITSVEEKHEDFNQTIAESNKSFLSTTTSTTDESRRSTAKGSSLAGTNIVLQAGDQTTKTGDITIQGSNIAATDMVSINAGRDLAILSAEDSASAISSVQVTHDGFTMGSSGLEFGKRNLSNITDGSTTQISSSITGKTILTQSGNDTRVRASNIQSTDNTILYSGGNLYIESAANTTRHNQETTESKVGLNIAMMDGRLHDISVGRNSQVTEDGKTSVTQVGSQIGSEGSLNLLSGHNMLISASKLKAGTDMNLNAGGDIVVSGQYDQTATDKSTANRMSSMNSKNKTGDQTQNYTFVGSTLDAGDNLNIKAGNNIDLTAAKLGSGTDTNLTAEEGQVRFRTQKNIKVVNHTFDNEDLVYEIHKGDGNQNESLVYTQMKTGGKLNVDAAKGVVVEVEEVPVTPAAEETTDKETSANQDDKDGEDDKNKASATFSASTAALVKQPGMEWMGQMLKRDDVDWQKALAAHEHWDYKSQGLTKAGAVILTIVVTYFTAGTASSVAGSTSTAVGGTAGAAAGAAAAAAVTSLATTAALSFANNGGDLGKTLEDMGKSENVRGLLTAMVTAGALSELNTTLNLNQVNAKSSFSAQLQKNLINSAATATINTAVYGGSLSDNLEAALKSAFIDTGAAKGANLIGDLKLNGFTNVFAHAIAGCVAGQARTGDCSSGALGAAVGDMAAQLIPEPQGNLTPSQISAYQTQVSGYAKIFSGIAAALTGNDVNIAANAGANAAENNYLSHWQQAAYDKEIKACSSTLCVLGTMMRWGATSVNQDAALVTGMALGAAFEVKDMATALAHLGDTIQALSNDPNVLGTLKEGYLQDLKTTYAEYQAALEDAGVDGATMAGTKFTHLLNLLATPPALVATGGVALTLASEKVVSVLDKVAKIDGVVVGAAERITVDPLRLDGQFQTLGLQRDPLTFPDGVKMVQQLQKSGLSQEEAVLAAREYIKSGSTLPVSTPLDVTDKLVKVVPAGGQPSWTTGYWMRESDLPSLTQDTASLSSKLGLPPGMQVDNYDVYQIVPHNGAVVFESKIAPTAVDGVPNTVGGANQAIVVDRNQFTLPVKIDTIVAKKGN